jgi:hypothetical protein
MNNTLVDLQNHIFKKIEKLGEDGLTGEEARVEVAKAMAIDALAKTAIVNAATMTKYAHDNNLVEDIPIFPLPGANGLAKKEPTQIAEVSMHS